MNGGFMGAITYEYDSASKTAEIIFDASKLYFGNRGGSKLPSHIERGQHFTQGLYDYMMYGEFPSYKTNNIAFGFEGLDYGMSEYISEWLTDYASGKIREELRKQGFSIDSVGKLGARNT